MITIHTVTIIEKTRADYRRTLTELFLSEAPGAPGLPTKYEYNVEKDNAGNIIYLKRPTNLNKGFDFEVRVSNMRFKHINKNGRISYSNRPSHDNIIDDLAEKKAEDSSQFTLLLTVIDAIFNCVEIDPQIYCKFSFRSGYPVDMICKCIKWLFIEQDITYWNWSGRNMQYNGIKNVLYSLCIILNISLLAKCGSIAVQKGRQYIHSLRPMGLPLACFRVQEVFALIWILK